MGFDALAIDEHVKPDHFDEDRTELARPDPALDTFARQRQLWLVSIEHAKDGVRGESWALGHWVLDRQARKSPFRATPGHDAANGARDRGLVGRCIEDERCA